MDVAAAENYVIRFEGGHQSLHDIGHVAPPFLFAKSLQSTQTDIVFESGLFVWKASQFRRFDDAIHDQSGSHYVLKASFTENTRLTVKIDDKEAEHLNFPAGATQTWNAGKSIVISLPSATSAMLTLNDLPLALPKKPAGQEITISLPEFLLQ